MRLVYWFIDALAAVTFAVSENAMKSVFSFLLFLPLIAIMIPIFIWLEQKKKRGDKIDYTW